MYLGTKNVSLVIALEPWAAPKNLGSLPMITGTDMGPPPGLITSWISHTVRRTALHLHSKPHIPQGTNAPILRAQQKQWGPRTHCTGTWKPKATGARGVAMPTGRCTYWCGAWWWTRQAALLAGLYVC